MMEWRQWLGRIRVKRVPLLATLTAALCLGSVAALENGWGRQDSVLSIAVTADGDCAATPRLHLSRIDDRGSTLPRHGLRVAIQFTPTLGAVRCSGVSVTSNLRPSRARFFVPSASVHAPVWFYVDAVNSFEAKPAVIAPSVGELWNVEVPAEQRQPFAGAIEFDVDAAVSATRWFEEDLRFNALTRAPSSAGGNDAMLLATLRTAEDVRLDLNRAVPLPDVALPAAGANHYEFQLTESVLGNRANGAHWFAVNGTMVQTRRERIHGSLLFVLSAVFGVSIGVLLERSFFSGT